MKPPLSKRAWMLLIAAAVLVLGLAAGSAAAEKAQKGWLGITMQEMSGSMAEAMDLDVDEGVLVSSVVDDSPADEAGIEDGDIIVAYDGREVEETDDLVRWVGKTEPGESVTVTILRDGKQKDLTVEIGARDEDVQKFIWKDDDGDMHFEMPELDDDNVYFHGGPGDDDHRIIIKKFAGDHGYLGVSLQDVTEQLGDYFGVEDGEGALIQEVIEDSPAAEAGLKAGDVIVRIDGQEVESPADVTQYMMDTEEGDEVEVEVVRNKRARTFTAILAESPNTFKWEGNKEWITRAPQMQKQLKMLPKLHGEQMKKLERLHEYNSQDEMEGLREEMDSLRKEMQKLKKELKRELRDSEDEGP